MSIRKMLPEFIKRWLRKVLQEKSWHMSQAGQDIWVFGEVFNEKRDGYFVDIGAYDGVSISNTYFLEDRYNWTGLCIEANPLNFKDLQSNRKAVCLNVCLDLEEGEVDFVLRDDWSGIVSGDVDNKDVEENGHKVIKLATTTLNQVLKNSGSPKVIDYLSIDVEGAEERILAKFNFDEYQFKCITIERPSGVLRALLGSKGYILIKEIPGLDCFYLHHNFAEDYRKNLIRYYAKKYMFMRWQ